MKLKVEAETENETTVYIIFYDTNGRNESSRLLLLSNIEELLLAGAKEIIIKKIP